MIVKFTTEAEDQVEACQNILKDLRYDQNILEYQVKKVEEIEEE
jgi:hypothetical protein